MPLVRCAALHSSDPPAEKLKALRQGRRVADAGAVAERPSRSRSTLGFLIQLQFVKTAHRGQCREVKGPGSMIRLRIQAAPLPTGRQYLYLHPTIPACSHPPPFLPLLTTSPQPRAVVHCRRALYPAAGGLPDMLFWLGIAIVALVVWKLLDDNR